MITKEQFAQAMARECDIIVHLFTKLPADAYDYRPSAGQRSTTELLRYLSICAAAGIRCMSEADWKLFAGYTERAKELAPADFPAAMERQKQEILSFFDSVSESTLLTQEAPMPGGQVLLPLGAAILNGPMKWLASYKMQLFLYAKACGVELKTPNLWRGSDPVAKG